MTPAAKFDFVMELVQGSTIYCGCDPRCMKIVGHYPPLISKDEAMRMLDFTIPKDEMKGGRMAKKKAKKKKKKGY